MKLLNFLKTKKQKQEFTVQVVLGLLYVLFSTMTIGAGLTISGFVLNAVTGLLLGLFFIVSFYIAMRLYTPKDSYMGWLTFLATFIGNFAISMALANASRDIPKSLGKGLYAVGFLLVGAANLIMQGGSFWFGIVSIVLAAALGGLVYLKKEIKVLQYLSTGFVFLGVHLVVNSIIFQAYQGLVTNLL
jgi:hypothetical protein